jgi:hypothetical protein
MAKQGFRLPISRWKGRRWYIPAARRSSTGSCHLVDNAEAEAETEKSGNSQESQGLASANFKFKGESGFDQQVPRLQRVLVMCCG